MTTMVYEHGRQCMPCSINFSMTLQTKILSIEPSDFLKQIIIRSFNCVFDIIGEAGKALLDPTSPLAFEDLL